MFPSKIVKMLQDGEMSKIIIAKYSHEILVKCRIDNMKSLC